MLMMLMPAVSTTHAAEEPMLATATARRTEVAQLIVKLKATQPGGIAASSVDRPLHTAETFNLLKRVVGRAMRAAAKQSAHAHAHAQHSADEIVYAREMSGAAHLIGLGTPVTDAYAIEIARRIAAEPEVEYAQPDYRMYAQLEPSDPLYAQQWAYHDAKAGANVSKAWDMTTGSSTIVTAFVDSGFRMHADLAANMLPGYDFLGDVFSANDGDGRDPDASDPGDWLSSEDLARCNMTIRGVADSSWHGTHVAGTIGAAANNNAGGVGVNWQGRLLPIRVLGKCGGQISDMLDAVRWAAGLPVPGVPENPYPAKIINLSLGSALPCGDATQEAIDDVIKKGVSVVAAVGNSDDEVGEPANCNGVIAVAAIDEVGEKAPFSNYGARVDIGAPGMEIISTMNKGTTVPGEDNYALYSGTSMAAPHVAGTIGLMLAVNPELTPEAIRTRLRSTTRPYPSESSCVKNGEMRCGTGMLDAARAVEAAKPTAEASPITVVSPIAVVSPMADGSPPADALR
jgi:serine protease